MPRRRITTLSCAGGVLCLATRLDFRGPVVNTRRSCVNNVMILSNDEDQVRDHYTRIIEPADDALCVCVFLAIDFQS